MAIERLYGFPGLKNGFQAVFIDSCPEIYKCSSCKVVTPVLYKAECQHSFCSQCIYSFKSGKTCPVDLSIVDWDLVKRDHSIVDTILSLQTYCPNKNEGCKKILRLCDIQNHTSSCLFRTMYCPVGCEVKIIYKLLSKHIIEECSLRTINCEFCDLDIHSKEKIDHEKSCPKKPTLCCYCNAIFERENIDHHINTSCTEKPIKCSFSDIGCTFTGKNDDVHQHESSFTDHSSALVKSIKKHDSEIQELQTLKENVVEILEDAISCQKTNEKQLQIATNDLEEFNNTKDHFLNMLNVVQQQQNGLIQSIQDMQTEIENLKCERDSFQQELKTANLEKVTVQKDYEDLRESFEDLKLKFKTTNHHISSIETDDKLKQINQIHGHHVTDQEDDIICPDGTFIWKISNFNSLLITSSDNNFIESEPFYVGMYGYCMQLRVEIQEKSSLLLKFAILKGKHDSALEWPFRKQVCLALVDQCHSTDLEYVIDTRAEFPTLFNQCHEDEKIYCPHFLVVNKIQMYNPYTLDDTIIVKLKCDVNDTEPRLKYIEGRNMFSWKLRSLSGVEKGVYLWDLTFYQLWRVGYGALPKLWSPSFYTDIPGYKIRLQVSDGECKYFNESLSSVVTCTAWLMQSEYDYLLQWPFKHDVIVSFLDKSGRGNHVQKAIKCETPLENTLSIATRKIGSTTLMIPCNYNYIFQNKICIKIKVLCN